MMYGAPDHPKTHHLAKLLHIPWLQAVGLLEVLFHWAARYAPLGDIGRWPDEAIAKAVRWGGDASALADRLVTAGWADRHPVHRLVLHDWGEHAHPSLKKRLKRKGLTPILSAQCPPDVQTEGGQCLDSGQTMAFPRARALALPIHMPCPDIGRPPSAQVLPQPEPSISPTPLPSAAEDALETGTPEPNWRDRIWTEFCARYPKQGRIRKRLDLQLFISLIDTKEQGQILLAGLERHCACQRWLEGFVPDAARFLSERMWQEDPPAPRPAKGGTPWDQV